MEPDSSCENCHVGRRTWWTDPWAWVPASGLLMATLWMWWPAATAASAIYLDYVWKVAGPFFLGLAIGGYLPAPGLIGSVRDWWWSLPWP